MMVIPHVDRCGEAHGKVPPRADAIDPSSEQVINVTSGYVITIHQGLLNVGMWVRLGERINLGFDGRSFTADTSRLENGAGIGDLDLLGASIMITEKAGVLGELSATVLDNFRDAECGCKQRLWKPKRLWKAILFLYHWGRSCLGTCARGPDSFDHWRLDMTIDIHVGRY
jgi:hypothetical protein